MSQENQSDQGLKRIIVYALSVSFSGVLASLQALRPAPRGFAFRPSWGALALFVIGALILAPCFHVIVHSNRVGLRRAAVGLVALIGLGSFFYPLRFVPRENLAAVFTGLALAAVALSIVACLLLVVRRFFEQS